MHGVCLEHFVTSRSPKVSDSPSQPRKQVEPLMMLSFIWLPGQCKNYQQNSFLAPSPVELCMRCAFEHFSQQPIFYEGQRFHISMPRKQVEQLLWCLSAGYRGSVRTSNRTPFWHLPRGSCAWSVFGTLCHQPSPKVSDSPSQPRKQVEQLLWCLSSGYRGSVRTTNRTPFWHLPRWSCAWGVFGTLYHPIYFKSQRFPISAQKAGRTTFVVSFRLATGAV